MCHRYFFFARTFSYLFFYHYLCSDLAYPEGRALVKTSMDYARKGMKGRFQNVIFNRLNIANLINLKISQRSVRVGCIISVCHQSDWD